MKRLPALFLVLAMVAVPSIAQKVTIDYAHDFDFDPVKTFAYIAPTDSGARDQLSDNRLRSAIIKELKEGGLRQVEADADLYVTYHVTTQDNTVFNTTSFGYGGYGGGWGGYGRRGYGGYHGGIGSTSTTASTYTEGTLIIDAYEPSEKKLVWRGTATVTVKDKPEKQSKQIDSILAKMGKKWDKILANQGK